MDFMNRIIGLVVALVVGGVIVGGLLIPSIEAMTPAEKTIQNVGMPYTEAGEDHIIIVTADGITYDGESVDVSKFPGDFQNYTLVYGEESFVRWNTSNVLTASDGNGLTTFNISTNTITITLTGTSVTVTTSGSGSTFTADDVLFHISPPGGDYALTLNPYVNDESNVYAAGDTYFSGTGRPGPIRLWIVWTGTLDDITITADGFNGSSYDSSTVALDEVNLTNITTNLYRYDSVLFDYTATATVDDVPTDYTMSATYTYFLAPATISYDNPAYIGATNAALMGVVALMGIVILVVVAANGIRSKY